MSQLHSDTNHAESHLHEICTSVAPGRVHSIYQNQASCHTRGIYPTTISQHIETRKVCEVSTTAYLSLITTPKRVGRHKQLIQI